MRRRKARPRAQGAVLPRRGASGSPARSQEAQGTSRQGPARCSAAENECKLSAAFHPTFAPSLPGSAASHGPAEPASSCPEGGLGPPCLRDDDGAGCHVHVFVGHCSNYGVPQDSCHPPSPGTLSVPCLRGDPARPSDPCSHGAPSCPPSIGHNHGPAPGRENQRPPPCRDLACAGPVSSGRVLRLFSRFFAQGWSSAWQWPWSPSRDASAQASPPCEYNTCPVWTRRRGVPGGQGEQGEAGSAPHQETPWLPCNLLFLSL